MEWCKGFWSKTVTMYIKDIILPILLRHGILFFIFFLLSFNLSLFLIYYLSSFPSFALSLSYARSLTIHLSISFFLSLIFCAYIIRSHITTGARPTSTMYLQMYVQKIKERKKEMKRWIVKERSYKRERAKEGEEERK